MIPAIGGDWNRQPSGEMVVQRQQRYHLRGQGENDRHDRDDPRRQIPKPPEDEGFRVGRQQRNHAPSDERPATGRQQAEIPELAKEEGEVKDRFVASGNFTLNLVKAFSTENEATVGPRQHRPKHRLGGPNSNRPGTRMPVAFRQASRVLFLIQRSQSSPFPRTCQTVFGPGDGEFGTKYSTPSEKRLHYSLLQLSSGITEIVALAPRRSPVHRVLWEMSHASWKTVSDGDLLALFVLAAVPPAAGPALSAIPRNRPRCPRPSWRLTTKAPATSRSPQAPTNCP